MTDRNDDVSRARGLQRWLASRGRKIHEAVALAEIRRQGIQKERGYVVDSFDGRGREKVRASEPRRERDPQRKGGRR